MHPCWCTLICPDPALTEAKSKLLLLDLQGWVLDWEHVGQGKFQVFRMLNFKNSWSAAFGEWWEISKDWKDWAFTRVDWREEGQLGQSPAEGLQHRGPPEPVPVALLCLLMCGFRQLILAIGLACVTPILANSKTWCSEQLLQLQRGGENKIHGRKKSSILVYLTHTVICVSYISFNKLLCNSYRAWYNDWFKITALLKLHCSSSSWVIFMWSVKLSNK